MAYDVGDPWTPILEVRDENDELTAATVTLEVTSPSGTVSNPTVTSTTTGVYRATLELTEQGQWTAKWTSTVGGVEEQFAYVRRLGSNVVSVNDVKARLNKTLRVDDAEIEAMIDAAIAEYEEWVAPVSGEVTERYDGGRTSLVLRSPRVREVTAVTYTDGTSVDVADLDLNTATGVLGWGFSTAGVFNLGTRNVEVTYTVQPLPANHREAIIADVAGYFEATQRGPAARPGEGYEAPFTLTPLVMFPRIRALAVPSIA